MSLRVVPNASEPSAAGPELHVAALPFPSYQGTQGAIRSMLESRNAVGTRAELHTYGSAGYAWAPTFPLHRGPEHPRLSLRSGPSWPKVLTDVRMARSLHSLVQRTQPRLLVAHHVEAMALACSVPGLPRVFFAHTDLAAELPTYAASRYQPLLGLAGGALDRVLCTRADAVAAISPALCGQLNRSNAAQAVYVPTPWPVPLPIRTAERARARPQLGLASDATVALYAGNLDAYQDAEQTLLALHQLATHDGPRVTLLLATCSEPQRFLRRAISLGVPFRTCALGEEPVRRMIHAAADFAIVPRAVPGGLPIKLLDALARGLPCALVPLAAAGLALSSVAVCADAPGPQALGRAVAALASQRQLRLRLSHAARDYVARYHSDACFGSALDAVVERARRSFLDRSGQARIPLG